MNIKQIDDIAVIKLSGDIDLLLSKELKASLAEYLHHDVKRIYIDFSDVSFIDSHGIGLLVHILKKVHSRNGELIFAGVHGQPQSILNMVGFNESVVSYTPTLNIQTKN